MITKRFLSMAIFISGWVIFSSKGQIMAFFWYTIPKDILLTTKVIAAKGLTILIFKQLYFLLTKNCFSLAVFYFQVLNQIFFEFVFEHVFNSKKSTIFIVS
jgi:hypothetical protein